MAKNARKAEYVNYITPFGIARFPAISAPDTEGKLAKGNFKTELIIDEDDVKKTKADVEAIAKELLPGIPLSDINIPFKELFNKNKETGERTSVGWGFRSKSKDRPAVFDSKRITIPTTCVVGPGSEICISGAFKAYERENEQIVVENGKKTKQQVTEYGLTFYLNSVQVKVLRSGGGKSDGSEFGIVDGGFEYEGVAGSEFADSDDAMAL